MRSPYAPVFLFAYSFLETLITVIPIDPFAVAVMIADKKRVYSTALYIVLGSLTGAVAGFWIGQGAFHEWGVYLLGNPSALKAFDHVRGVFFQHEFLITFATAFVPIPKTPTIIAAGFLNGSMLTYVVAWGVGRTLHFVAEALVVQLSVGSELPRTLRALFLGSIAFLCVVVAYIALTYSGLT